jgi:hypothetical protein
VTWLFFGYLALIFHKMDVILVYYDVIWCNPAWNADPAQHHGVLPWNVLCQHHFLGYP